MRGGEEEVSDIAVVEANKEDWDFYEVVGAAETKRSGVWWKLGELQTACRLLYMDMSAGLVYIVWMAKRSLYLEKQPKEIFGEVQKIQCELQVARSNVLEVQHLISSKLEKACL